SPTTNYAFVEILARGEQPYPNPVGDATCHACFKGGVRERRASFLLMSNSRKSLLNEKISYITAFST
ncbi:MAG: hypothetical protein PUP92_06775, partial [Rhizonema sp. PD38]|nr:hypothetical protein [Rhizonema sp. PD38]